MRQLTGVDASFLAWEGPTTFGHITGVLIIDPSTGPVPWTFELFTRLLRSRIDRLEPLTLKLVEVPLGLDRPYWIPDPDFDLENHLRYVAVPGGGGPGEFADLVARIHERPLDRRRPLWECWVVDGLAPSCAGPGRPGRRSRRKLKAVITKIHHAAIDGLSGQEILAGLVDLEPTVADDVADPDGPYASGRPAPNGGTAGGSGPPSGPGSRGVEPQSGEVLGRAAVSIMTSPARMVRAASALARAMPVLGAAFSREGPAARGNESTRELLRRFGAAPSTPFNATIGPHRRWAFVSCPLDEVKAVKNAAGCTVNDVVLALVAGVLRDWLITHEALPDRPLAAMVPLSVRPAAGDGGQAPLGNYLSSTITTLATHLEDPAERLAAIKSGMDAAKRQQAALPASILTDLTQVAPPAVAALAARLVASTRLADRMTLPFNVVVSNVPGPPIPLYLAGALIMGHFPVSTIVDGVGLNVTVVSTNGMLDFGFVSDRDLVPDLWSMAEAVPVELARLARSVDP